MVADDGKKNCWKCAQEATRQSTLNGHRNFEPGELLLDWADVESLDLQGCDRITVTMRPQRFKFELDGRGRVISFESIKDVQPGAALQVNIVQRA
jgi:hypothetical protein